MPVSEASGDQLPEGDSRTPVEVPWFRLQAEQQGFRWRQVSFGPSFGAARSDTGKLFVWGSCRSRDGPRSYMEPRALVFEGAGVGTRFRDVQCSETAVWALTTAGEVVVWERLPAMILDSTTAPPQTEPGQLVGGRRLGSLDRPVRAMSVGASHAAFITDDGEVYCLGSNRCGECGADPAAQGTAVACRRVQFPRHCNPIARVKCGRSHTVAVGAEGQTLAWGDDSKIQLGLGDTRSNIGDERPWSGSRGYHNFVSAGEGMAPPSALRGGPDAPSFGRARATSAARYSEFEAHFQWRPSFMMDIPLEFERQVHGMPYPPPDALECGDDFTVLIVRDSPDWALPEEESQRIFCCGENVRGQCGRSLQASQQVLAATRLPKNVNTLALSCGSAHCLSLLRRVGARKRELWSWGSNDHGQAGGTNAGVVCPAVRLRLPRDARIEAVSCGFCSSAVICSDRPAKAKEAAGVAGEA